jgi:hypothetical protein
MRGPDHLDWSSIFQCCKGTCLVAGRRNSVVLRRCPVGCGRWPLRQSDDGAPRPHRRVLAIEDRNPNARYHRPLSLRRFVFFARRNDAATPDVSGLFWAVYKLYTYTIYIHGLGPLPGLGPRRSHMPAHA